MWRVGYEEERGRERREEEMKWKKREEKGKK